MGRIDPLFAVIRSVSCSIPRVQLVDFLLAIVRTLDSDAVRFPASQALGERPELDLARRCEHVVYVNVDLVQSRIVHMVRTEQHHLQLVGFTH